MKFAFLSIAIGVLPLFSTAAFAGHFCELASENLKVQTYILTDTAAGNGDAMFGLAKTPAAVILSQAGSTSLLTGTYGQLPSRTGMQYTYQLKDSNGAAVNLTVTHWFKAGNCGRADCDWKEVVSGNLHVNGERYALSCEHTPF